MGVAGLWDILRPAGKTRSLTELSVSEGFEANPDGVRGFRIGIDASIWFFHAEYGKEGENPVLRTLFFRCATLMHSPFLPLFVFDGPKRPDFKRGKKINRTSHKLIPGMKTIVESFGFEWRMAPGEAEAELAYLNRIGVIDGILSDDVDNFLFGAKTVIRNPSNNLSGNRANPVVNALGKDDKNHTKVYRLSEITAHSDVRLTRGGMILVGLMSGGDYQQEGLARCGTVISHGLAKCGFGETLYQAARDLNRDELQTFLGHWRRDIRHELRTNSQGHIGKKHPALAKSIPETFPDIDILLSYTNPVTSESMGKAKNNLQLTWSKEPNLGKLAATCEFYFEWGYREAIIKRFRSVIWHSAILRILRRTVLDLDAGRIANEEVVPGTPQKTKHSSPKSVRTPSKMIAKHFSSCTIGELKGYLSDSEDDGSERLIVKVHSSRRHVSTDGVLEYRLEIAPAQLVRIAESGIKGLRQPEGPDEWADDDEEDSSKKKPPPDPESHMRVWMPACMVALVEPHLVEDFEAAQRKKQEKTSAKGRVKPGGKSKAAADPIVDDDRTTTRPIAKAKGTSEISKVDAIVGIHQDSERGSFKEARIGRIVRDLTKGAAKSQGMLEGTRGDLKTFFSSTKPLKIIRDKSNTMPAYARPASGGRGSLILNANADAVFKHNKKPPSQSSTTRPNVMDESALSRTLACNAPGSGYLEISESQNYSSHSKPCALVSDRVSFCNNDDLFEKDPFDDATLPTQCVPVARVQSRRHVSHSSSESDSIDFRHKVFDHASPRSTRIQPYSEDDVNEDTHYVNRRCSPSPLLPFACSTKYATTGKTSQTAGPMPLIDISSDSEDSDEQVTIPPLELARSRAKDNFQSSYPKQKSLRACTDYTQPERKQPTVKCPSVQEDIIDLT